MGNKIVSTLLAFSVILAISCHMGCVKATVEDKGFNNNTSYMAYAQIAEKIAQIIKAKDENGLLDFIAPPGTEGRGEIEAAFNNKNSTGLYSRFFGKRQSVRSFMQDASDLRYEIIEYPDGLDEYLSKAIEIIYYDKKQIKILKGLHLQEVKQLVYDNKAITFSLFQPASKYGPPSYSKKHWYLDITGHGLMWKKNEEELSEVFPLR